MAIAVKYIHEGMRGAPVLAGQVGLLIALIDAFLINGWGLVTATGINVADGIATVGLTAGETFEVGSAVLVAGATPAALNGEQRVLTASATSITFATTAANGAASGTITARYAPVGGWAKVFTGTNLAVYRSTDVTGARMYYRVQDTGTTVARIVGYVSMTGVSTGTGPFPTSAQRSGGSYWPKSINANAAPVQYFMAADSKALLAAIGAGSSSAAESINAPVMGFGEMVALNPAGDSWASVVAFAPSDWATSVDASSLSAGASDQVFVARAYIGTGAALSTRVLTYTASQGEWSGVGAAFGAYPSVIDGRLLLSRRYICAAQDNTTPRAEVPGLLHSPQNIEISKFSRLEAVECSGDLAGRRLLAVRVMPDTYAVLNEQSRGVSFVDVTGPWRQA